MQFNKALYLKELKQHRVVFTLFIILVIVVAVLRALNNIFHLPFVSNNVVILGIPFILWLNIITFTILPIILIYSWYREELDRTTYQLLSVPVSPSSVLFNTFLAFLTIAPASIIMTLPLLFTPDMLIGTLSYTMLIRIGVVLCQIGIHAFTLGVACLVIARGQKYRRYRLLSGLSTIVLSMFALPIGISITFVISILMTSTMVKYRWYRFFAAVAIIFAAIVSIYILVTRGEYANIVLSVVFAGLLITNSGLGVMVYSVNRFETSVDVC